MAKKPSAAKAKKAAAKKPSAKAKVEASKNVTPLRTSQALHLGYRTPIEKEINGKKVMVNPADRRALRKALA